MEMEGELWLLLRLQSGPAATVGSALVYSAPGDELMLAPVELARMAAAWTVDAGAWTVLL